MLSNRGLIFFLSVIFFSLFGRMGIAQHNRQPLESVLDTLEQRHEITFTYLDENVKGIELILPAENLSLRQALEHLHQSTGLVFQLLNDRFVTISKTPSKNNLICGYIRNKETNEPLAGATVASGNAFTVTNEEGYFQLKKIQEQKLVTIQFLGFNSQILPANHFQQNPCQKIFLKPQPTTLSEIFVHDYLTEGIIKRTDGSIALQTQSVGILPGLTDADVLHTIQSLPGIQSINESVSHIHVRGGTNDQNHVLWEGIPMYQTGHFFGLITAFNPYLTEKVELTKNGTSAALGQSVSSTIDIRTDNRVNEQFTAGAGMSLLNGDVYTKIPFSSKASLLLSARRSVADLFQTPTYKSYFEQAFVNTDVARTGDADNPLSTNKDFHFYDLSSKLLYDISDQDKLRVSLLMLDNDIRYEETEAGIDKVEKKTSGLSQRSMASGIIYSRLWNDKMKTSGQLYFSSYELGAINYDMLYEQRLIQENNVTEAGLKLDHRWSLNPQLDLFSGYQFTETGVRHLEDINNPNFRRLVKNILRTHTVFIESNYNSPSKNTYLRIGLRNNYITKFNKLLLEPRFTFHQKLGADFAMEVMGEMKSQTTSQVIDYQTDFLGIEKRRWVLANQQDIPIIRSRQLSAGIHYTPHSLLISIEGYVKRVNGITSSSQGFQNQFQYQRTAGSYYARGIDFFLNKKVNKFNSWLAYSWANNTYHFDAFNPSTFPNNLDITHSITLGGSYHTGDLQLSTGINWHSGKPFTRPSAENEMINSTIVYQSPNSSRLENYIRIDFSARYNFVFYRNIRGQLAASLWNIFGTKNTLNRYYRINDSKQIEQIDQEALGLTPNLIFRLKF